jgi:hypothetical protein
MGWNRVEASRKRSEERDQECKFVAFEQGTKDFGGEEEDIWFTAGGRLGAGSVIMENVTQG